jgi:hypothetical protein
MLRRFYTGMPVIMIYENAVLKYTLRFSELDNQPEVRTTREPYSLAPPTLTANGELVPHDFGCYLRHRVSCQVWPEDSCYDGVGLKVTEREVGLLWWARQNAATVQTLFYPHSELAGLGSSEFDPDYSVLVLAADLTRPGLAQDRVAGEFEFLSRYPITDMDKFAWV